MQDFNTIKSVEELRAILGYPSELVKNKAIDALDEHCRQFISKSPLLIMATSDAEGLCDVSPRGDLPGFVLVLDDNHLVIPERPGNRRMDSLRNILSNPNAGLIFLIPGLEETLRVNGHAYIVRDEELLVRMESHGRTPLVGIVIEVEECYMHCAKSLKRSSLWNPDSWITKAELPNVAQMISDHAKLPGMNAEKVKASLQDSYTNRMY
ncbi:MULTISPECIES: pyridoxamine 5'-phosphate oxidase family protein [Paenibacillus]|uniref:Phosphohydrolase n=1 Tax=Paenibacillus borealis TaxID=160799 RepID=A0ABX3HA52_PAEBO|nr:pyridoxamine 5'-phosphate oxidase family protein [Paenibacillus borealis]OMD47347.1 phosphohydrolase [Paenibacillus borealis]